jgi:hypothetical protein
VVLCRRQRALWDKKKNSWSGFETAQPTSVLRIWTGCYDGMDLNVVHLYVKRALALIEELDEPAEE